MVSLVLVGADELFPRLLDDGRIHPVDVAETAARSAIDLSQGQIVQIPVCKRRVEPVAGEEEVSAVG
jgi:hypothetical protein